MDIPSVIFENDDLIVLYKPKGLPTAPLKGQQTDTLLDWVIDFHPEISSVKGKSDWEPGLLHRLDTPTSGLVLVARNQVAFDRLSDFQDRNFMVKTYIAEVEKSTPDLTFPPLPYQLEAALRDGFPMRPFAIESYFRPFGVGRKSVRPCVRGSRNASHHYYRTEFRDFDGSQVKCLIKNGFRHQIRCHLSWLGYPIKGDGMYGLSDDVLKLECTAISFPSLSSTGKIMRINMDGSHEESEDSEYMNRLYKEDKI